MAIKLNTMQEEYLEFAKDKEYSICQAAPGKGKSLAAVAVYDRFYRKEGKLCIMVQPTAKHVFDKELRWMRLSSILISKNIDLQTIQFATNYDVLIITDTILKKAVISHQHELSSFLQKTSMMIVDEIHTYRSDSDLSTNSSRFIRWFRRIRDHLHKDHRIVALSATIQFNSLLNWYTIFSILDDSVFGSELNFYDNYVISKRVPGRVKNREWDVHGSITKGEKQAYFRDIVGYKNIDHLREKIKPWVFFSNNFDFTLNLHKRVYKEPKDTDTVEKYKRALRGTGIRFEYKMSFDSGTKIIRQSTDVININGKYIRVDEIEEGQRTPFGKLVEKEPREITAESIVKLVKMCVVEDTFDEKLAEFLRVVKECADRGEGVLCFFAYLDSLELAKQAIEHILHREVVVFTGQSPKEAALRKITSKSIVLGTRAVSQSLSLYMRNVCIFSGLSSVGQMEQLCGRICRFDSDYREVNVYFIVGPGCFVSNYLYQRLRFLYTHSVNNCYFNQLPDDKEVTDLRTLKDTLLWQKAESA